MDEKAEKKLNKRLRDREKERQFQRNEFIKAACNTPQGREYFYWLMAITKMNSNPFNGNALGTSFQCGEMNIGQQVREHLISVTPQGYLNILQEKQKEIEDDRLTSSTTGPDEDE